MTCFADKIKDILINNGEELKEKIQYLLEGNIEYTEWVEDDIAYVEIDCEKSAGNIVDEIMRQLESKQ